MLPGAVVKCFMFGSLSRVVNARTSRWCGLTKGFVMLATIGIPFGHRDHRENGLHLVK